MAYSGPALPSAPVWLHPNGSNRDFPAHSDNKGWREEEVQDFCRLWTQHSKLALHAQDWSYDRMSKEIETYKQMSASFYAKYPHANGGVSA